ncbi:MAG TPA: peroxidase-related enzyme [Terriglobia bacterium]|nr:peroxidase-related enzyme [Terriglobia bacterium]
MSYIRGASADARDIPALRDFEASFGFIPNFYRAQTNRPDLINAEAGLFEAVMVRDSALTRRLKEYVFLVCSSRNLSTYCVTAHCEMVRMLGIEGPEPEQIAFDHTAAEIPEREKALLDFVAKVNSHPRTVGPDDVDLLRARGFEDAHILEAVLVVGLAKFANFVAFGLGTVPDFDPFRVDTLLGLPPGAEKILNPSSVGSIPMNQGAEAPAPELVDDDADLVRRTRSGDLRAFDELAQRHQQRIYRTLMAITRSPDDAEDGLQNVFFKAFQHLGGFQGASKFVTWLTRIAINEGAERLRARKDLESLDADDSDKETVYQSKNIADWQANPEELYSREELRRHVEQGLLKVPVKYRIVVTLRDLQQLSAEETAEVLQIGIPAMKSRLLRGRLMLREALAPVLGKKAAHV